MNWIVGLEMCSYFFYWFFLLNSIYKEKTFSFVQNSIIFIRYLISIQSDMPISNEVIHPWASCFHVTCFRRNEENMKRNASRTRQKIHSTSRFFVHFVFVQSNSVPFCVPSIAKSMCSGFDVSFLFLFYKKVSHSICLVPWSPRTNRIPEFIR